MASPRFTVAIVGGGIAGLTLALALGKYPDIQVHVYEAASEFGELGVGIGFTPRSWGVFEKLGADVELLKHTNMRPSKEETPIAIRRKSNQPEGFIYYRNTASGKTIAFHRPDCQSALLRQLPPSCQVSVSKRLVSYKEEGSQVHLSFQDGSAAYCDVLIGGDGYRSTVRRCLVQDRAKLASSEQEAAEILLSADPFFTGSIAYRGVVRSDKLLAAHPDHSVLTAGTPMILYCGLNGYITAYPIQHGKLVNVAAFHLRHDLEYTTFDGPHASVATPSDVAAVFGDYEPEVQSLIKCLDHVTKWAIHGVKPMQTFVHKNVALLGDAAHAMTPFLGAGAGQAAEDAYILGTVLGHTSTTRETINRALQVYDLVRRPIAQAAQENSRKSGHGLTFKFNGIDFENRTDPQELWEDLQHLGEASQILIDGTNSGDVDLYHDEALKLLQ